MPSFRSPTTKRHALACSAIAIIGVAGIGIVRAVDGVSLEVERVAGAGWSAEDIVLEIGLPERSLNARASIRRLSLMEGAPWRNVEIRCPAIEIDAHQFSCANANVIAHIEPLGAQRLQGAVAYDRRTGAIALDVRAARFAGGALRARGALESGGWQGHVELDGVDIEQVIGIANAFQFALPEITATGRISGSFEVFGATTLERARVDARLEALVANNASGTLASDALTLQVRADVIAAPDAAWRFDAHIDAPSGQAYAEPVFLDFDLHALRAQVSGVLDNSGAINAEAFAIEHDQVLRAEGSARVDFSQAQPVRDLALNLHTFEFPGGYTSYLQPFLIDTNFKSLQTSGRIEGVVQVTGGVPQHVALLLQEVNLDDGAGMFALQGLNGQVSWRDGADEDDDVVSRPGAERSSLRWRGGSLLNLTLGRSALQFTTIGRNFRLIEPASIPLLDGTIDLESLRIRDVGLPTVAFLVDATIRPISVAQLCRAFGWPEFGGSLGGEISGLRLRNGVVTLGTTLEARVFDGRVAIKDLRLEDALGNWPRFQSSIALTNLDLELVTRAFSFGRITGRLSGAIDNLQLFNWQPIAFDAKLYTPADDRSAHRISQRAVENIGSIGGGGAGITQALSGGVMRFFDEFRYDRLGLSCRLENEVCHMDGVAPAPNGGYYLVKGAGLPRIDVIGSAHRVDWPRLVKQLIAISESEGPVVE